MKKNLFLSILFLLLLVSCKEKTVIIENLALKIHLTNNVNDIDSTFQNLSICTKESKDLVVYEDKNVKVNIDPNSSVDKITIFLTVGEKKYSKELHKDLFLDALDYKVGEETVYLSVEDGRSVIINDESWDQNYIQFSNSKTGKGAITFKIDKKCQ